ncbi:MAG TPA: glycosyltransferase [Acidobacteriota bacterium]|nr:glycosyltransferase [Acidobacteriota bacterium]
MLKQQDIVIISSIDWRFLWQGPQEIAIGMSRAGNRVFYIENTGVRSPELRDLARVRTRFGRWARALRSFGVQRHAENVFVCSPLVLPPFGPKLRQWLNRVVFLPLIRRAACRLGVRDALIWTFLPTDTAVELIRQLRSPRSVVVYHCAADFSQLTPYRTQLHRSEHSLLQLSDLVFAICPELSERCATVNPRVHLFPYGVDLATFPLVEQTPNNGQARARHNSRPVIGYVGGMHRHVDFSLLAAMIRSRPDWTWVFVGPYDRTAHVLAELPNTRLLGQLQHRELAHVIRSFDVCIVPYVKSDYTRTVVPVKINEYLALGKPVVSTDIQPVVEFNELHHVLITSENKPAAFIDAIESALRISAEPAMIVRRREVAALSDWQGRLEAMSALIEDRLREKPP